LGFHPKEETLESKCHTFATNLQKNYRSKPILIKDNTRLKDHVITIFDKNYELKCQQKATDNWEEFQNKVGVQQSKNYSTEQLEILYDGLS
jgi:hypothetical protein